MVKAEAIKNGDGVDVKTEVEGITERNTDMGMVFTALVGNLTMEWIKNFTGEDVGRSDTYA